MSGYMVIGEVQPKFSDRLMLDALQHELEVAGENHESLKGARLTWRAAEYSEKEPMKQIGPATLGVEFRWTVHQRMPEGVTKTELLSDGQSTESWARHVIGEAHYRMVEAARS